MTSARRICLDTDLDGVPMAVRPESNRYAPGDRIEVEVGRRGVVVEGHRQQVAGHWVTCEVIKDTGRDLSVKLLA